MDEEGKKVFDQVNRPERLLRSDAMTPRSVRSIASPIRRRQDEKQRYLRRHRIVRPVARNRRLVAAREMDSQMNGTEWEAYGRDHE